MRFHQGFGISKERKKKGIHFAGRYSLLLQRLGSPFVSGSFGKKRGKRSNPEGILSGLSLYYCERVEGGRDALLGKYNALLSRERTIREIPRID